MLVEVTLRCFRQHVNRTFVFTEGLNLLRAKNEGGKSTILEAIKYALSGSRALSEPVSDVVTWDHKESDLYVKVVLRLLGVDYTFERSPKGATVTASVLEKPVTGQSEVTNYAADLMGGSAKTLNLLTLASQNGLQDVIEAGPGEVSSLVAKLGNLEVIDGVLEEAEKELALGSEKIDQDRISSLISMEEALVASSPATSELEALENEAAAVEETGRQAQHLLDNVLVPEMDVASANLAEHQRRAERISMSTTNVNNIRGDITRITESLQQAQSVTAPDTVRHEALLKELSEAESMYAISDTFHALEALKAKRPAMEWAADAEESAETEVLRAQAEAAAEVAEITRVMGEPYLSTELEAAQSRLWKAEAEPNPNVLSAAAKRGLADQPYLTVDIAEAQQKLDLLRGSLAVVKVAALKTIDASSLKCHACGRDFDDAEQRRVHLEKEEAEKAAAVVRMGELSEEIEVAEATLKSLRDQVAARRANLFAEADQELAEGEAKRRDTLKELRAALTSITGEIASHREGLLTKLREANRTHEAMSRLISDSAPFTAFIAANKDSGLISVDYRVYPPRIDWVGPHGRDRVRTAAEVKNDLREWDSYMSAYTKAQGVAETLTTTLSSMQSSLAEAQAILDSLPTASVEQISRHYEACLIRTSEQRHSVALLVEQAKNQRWKANEYKLKLTNHATELSAIRERLAEARARLETLQWNNSFVKEVKRLKPMVTEHMWGMSLATISNYFSDLRNQVVKVTRDGGSFRFNDRPASSLSGSGKDILAIAIRAALSRVFLPHVGMIVLDEPAHGSDEARTANILGFLAKCGFEQVILASHDPLSEAVADNIIYVQEDS